MNRSLGGRKRGESGRKRRCVDGSLAASMALRFPEQESIVGGREELEACRPRSRSPTTAASSSARIDACDGSQKKPDGRKAVTGLATNVREAG